MAALENFPPRDQAIVGLMLNLGFRISELLSLALGDVWAGGRIRPRVTVERARLKGGRSCRRRSVTARSVPLNARAAAALERHLFAMFGSAGPAGLEGPLFPGRWGGRLSRWQANRIVHQVLAAAGIEASGGRGEYGTHSLRKTFCLRVYRASGHDLALVRAAMNHSHIDTTQKYLPVEAGAVERVIMAIGMEQAGGRHEAGQTDGAAGLAGSG